jgi:hypothetical protein
MKRNDSYLSLSLSLLIGAYLNLIALYPLFRRIIFLKIFVGKMCRLQTTYIFIYFYKPKKYVIMNLFKLISRPLNTVKNLYQKDWI